MPTNRKRIARSRSAPPIDPDFWRILTDQEPSNPFSDFALRDDERRALWAEHRERILSEWVAAYPGTRPSHWWRYDAPRLPARQHGKYADCFFAQDLIQPRRQIRGTGVPAHTVSAQVPQWRLGIPEHMEKVNLLDPPIFESQIEYLERHKLLMPQERGIASN